MIAYPPAWPMGLLLALLSVTVAVTSCGTLAPATPIPVDSSTPYAIVASWTENGTKVNRVYSPDGKVVYFIDKAECEAVLHGDYMQQQLTNLGFALLVNNGEDSVNSLMAGCQPFKK